MRKEAEEININFKQYHGHKYLNCLHNELEFGKFVTRIKVMRNKGLRTDNHRLLKYYINKKFKEHLRKETNREIYIVAEKKLQDHQDFKKCITFDLLRGKIWQQHIKRHAVVSQEI